MCVIMCKPSGINMPKQDYIDNMWTRNSDGAGLMYAVDGRVKIEKGFMTYDALKERLDQLDDIYGLTKLPLVLHCRITTHGGTKPENCHPFPISDSVGMLSKLVNTAKVGVAHNGIIDIVPRKGISDTMEYIISQLSPLSKAVPEFYKNKYLMQMISNAIDSKMAFLDRNGEIYTIGKFENEDGIMYSNTSYKWGWYSYNYSYGHSSMYLPEGWEVYDVPEKTAYRSIMWLDDGQYVQAPDGTLYEGDYGIDSLGSVYIWDYDKDALVRQKGYEAFSAEGIPLRFDLMSKMTIYEQVIL